mgnify:CR=1 FL=1
MPTELQLKALRALPAVDEVLTTLSRSIPMEVFPHELVVDCIRKEVEAARTMILEDNTAPTEEEIANRTLRRLQAQAEPSLKQVINATGVILHTNLGRSALAPQALTAVENAAKGYSTLEYDLTTMQRGSRHSHCEELICTLTGAEAAIAVNNNAAAVMMVLNEFARNRQAVISRGELIEIGGSFRIPDIMDFSNAHMVEVGTTNKTHLSDYQNAITENTGALLKVHTSNFKIMGFCEEVSLEEMVELGHQHNIPVIYDLGSGAMVRLSDYGIQDEPNVLDSVKSGADIISFSGDKLLGGPQAGIIIGRREYIEAMKKNPLTRAFRIDKLTLAALEATLREYLDPQEVIHRNPTLRMITATMDDLVPMGQQLLEALQKVCDGSYRVTLTEDFGQVGGGSVPTQMIRSSVVAVEPTRISLDLLETRLREHDPLPVIARISKDRLLLDVRTIESRHFDYVAQSILDCCSK